MLGKPKYTYGDVVRFDCEGEKTGVIAIVDRHGTFEQNEEPSYDIYNKEENILYKHCRESLVLEKIGAIPEEEVQEEIWGKKENVAPLDLKYIPQYSAEETPASADEENAMENEPTAETEDKDGCIKLQEKRSVIWLPERAVEVRLTVKVFVDGEIREVEKVLDMDEVWSAFHDAEDNYDDPDAKYFITEKGLEWLDEIEKEG